METKPLRVFICQPNYQETEDEFTAAKMKATDYLKTLYSNRRLDIIGTLWHNDKPSKVTLASRVGYQVSQMCASDLIYFVDGYETDMSCQLLAAIAMVHGFHTIYVEAARRPNLDLLINRLKEGCSEGITLSKG